MSVMNIVEQHGKRAVIMFELSSEKYFDSMVSHLKELTEGGYEGVYISFQRPFENVKSMLEKKGINPEKFVFIDVASSLADEKKEYGKNCIQISKDIEIDELVRAVYTSLSKLESRDKFIFIDSLTTITLYKPLSEVLRFSKFAIKTVKKGKSENVSLILNVAKELSGKKFIQDIAFRADEVIEGG